MCAKYNTFLGLKSGSAWRYLYMKATQWGYCCASNSVQTYTKQEKGVGSMKNVSTGTDQVDVWVNTFSVCSDIDITIGQPNSKHGEKQTQGRLCEDECCLWCGYYVYSTVGYEAALCGYQYCLPVWAKPSPPPSTPTHPHSPTPPPPLPSLIDSCLRKKKQSKSCQIFGYLLLNMPFLDVILVYAGQLLYRVV